MGKLAQGLQLLLHAAALITWALGPADRATACWIWRVTLPPSRAQLSQTKVQLYFPGQMPPHAGPSAGGAGQAVECCAFAAITFQASPRTQAPIATRTVRPRALNADLYTVQQPEAEPDCCREHQMMQHCRLVVQCPLCPLSPASHSQLCFQAGSIARLPQPSLLS